MKFNVVVPRLLTVTVWPTLKVPTICGEKLTAVGDSSTAVPTPLRLTVCGLPLALSSRVKVPSRVPVPTGLNATLIVQLACGARLLEHVVAEMAKSAEGVMLLIVRDMVPVFFSVTFLAGLVVPSACVPNVRLVGARLTIGNPCPLPESETSCGLALALSGNSRLPVCTPVAAGLNDTFTVQAAPATSRTGQFVVSRN